MKEHKDNPPEIRKLLAAFILLDDNQFPNYQKLWKTACKTLGKNFNSTFRIEKTVKKAVKTPHRIKVEKIDTYYQMLHDSCRDEWFGPVPVRSVISKFFSVFDTGYSMDYFYHKVLNDLKLTKDNKQENTGEESESSIYRKKDS